MAQALGLLQELRDGLGVCACMLEEEMSEILG